MTQGLQRPRHDFGLILGMSGTVPAPTYVDRFDQVIEMQDISSGVNFVPMVDVDSSVIDPGLLRAMSFWVQVSVSPGQTFDVRVTAQPASDVDPTLWTPIQTIDENSGTSSASHTFSAAGLYLLQTASIHTVGKIRVEVKAGNEDADGDQIIVKAVGLA